MIDILKDKHIARRFFILAYVWMVMCMTYYGISFALGSLGGSLYISFAIGAIAEVGTSCLLPSAISGSWHCHDWLLMHEVPLLHVHGTGCLQCCNSVPSHRSMYVSQF